MILRENQIEAVQKGVEFFRQGKSVPSIIVAPTAYGKSIVIAKIAHEINEKILILQPSKELLEQNYSKFVALGGEAAIFSAAMNEKEIGNITYATIGSIVNHAHRFKVAGITKIIIDECDRYPRDPNGMLRKFLRNAKATHVLGLTATPLKLQSNGSVYGTYSKLVMLTSRSNKGNFFKQIIHVEQIQSMLEKGYWSPLKYLAFDFDTSELAYNTTGAEYTDESIQKVYLSQDIEQKVLKVIEMIPDRKAILIAVPSIADAIRLAKKIKNAAVVHSELDKKERNRVISEFKQGRIRIVVQVSILSVGFDYPELDCIISARPTASLGWWYQFVGRVTRIHPNKADALVVDLVGNVKKFGKIEDLTYTCENNVWRLRGEGGRILTGVPLQDIGAGGLLEDPENEITELPPEKLFEVYMKTRKPKVENGVVSETIIPFGKFRGSPIYALPKWYVHWVLTEFTWTERNIDLKYELESLYRKKS